ncbi:hypothetical protein ACL02R_24655 [Streptomyces sp. MS19]|uniref:hypothetical protein n=1 Tax=Streptomyces sp. MS19 TaxID=3385972 RepID=UPI0039A259B5
MRTGDGTNRTAVDWLASAAPEPAACRWEWERHPLGVALLPAGRLWDVLVVPEPLARPTLDVLTVLLDRPGPVLADRGDRRIGFFVPAGTAGRWLGTGVRAAGNGSWIVVPHPGRPAAGVRWLVPPDGSGVLTDPGLLELAMHEAAAVVGPVSRAPRAAAVNGRAARPGGCGAGGSVP